MYVPVIREHIQKHLGLFLDCKVSFLDHMNENIKKDDKGINVIRKILLLLPHSSLLAIYKSFVRPLDYGNVIYYQSNQFCLSNKVENAQQKTALAITGAIRGTSKENFYQPLGIQSLKYRMGLRRMSYIHNIVSRKLPRYLYEIVPPLQKSHCYPGSFLVSLCRNTIFRNSF